MGIEWPTTGPRHMSGLGQAIPLLSSMSREVGCQSGNESNVLGKPTHGGMLEGKGDNILDTFDGRCQRIARKAFADQNLDPTSIVTGIPMVLVEELSPKGRKPQGLDLASLGSFCDMTRVRTISCDPNGRQNTDRRCR